MAEISWIKLKTTMFDDEKICLIQSMPEADAILVVWIRLLVLAGKTNDEGLIYIQRNMPYSEEMLATLFGKQVSIIRLALTTLEQFQMVELNKDGTIYVANWEKHQNIEGMDKIRLQNAERNKRYRERKKQNLLNDVSATSRDGIDIDKELDIDKEYINHMSGEEEKIPYKEIIEYLNQKANKKFKVIQKHKDFIKARWNEGQRLDDFKQVVDNMVTIWSGQFFSGKPAENYLQPSTLFGNKFDQYLNQKPKTNVFDQENGFDDELGF